jgi:spore coat polysaccharide biosynthesis protein SpsF
MPDLIDKFITVFSDLDADYLSNTHELSYPDGLDVEIFKSTVLERLNGFVLTHLEKEHVTLGILNRKDVFKVLSLQNEVNLSHFRWTVDTNEDFEFIQMIFHYFKGQELTLKFEDLMGFFAKFPHLNQIVYR